MCQYGIGINSYSHLKIKSISNITQTNINKPEKELFVGKDPSGFCVANNIKLPNYITDKINVNPLTKIAFKCGGYIDGDHSRHCYAYIMDEEQNS